MALQNEKQKLKVAAYSILAALAIIFGVSAIYVYKYSSLLGHFFAEVSAGIFCVILIFVILNFFFATPEAEMRNEFETIRRSMSRKSMFYVTQDLNAQELAFIERTRHADTIDLVGYSLAHLISFIKRDLIAAIEGGAIVRICWVDPASTAGSLMAERVGDQVQVNEPIDRSTRYLHEIISAIAPSGVVVKGSVELRLANWIPSCYVNILNGSASDATMMVGIHAFAPGRSSQRRLYFWVSKKDDPVAAAFFKDQFERIWSSSENVIVKWPSKPT